MKRLFAAVLIVGLLSAGMALGEGRYLHVTGAKEWISLREAPSVSSKRLAQIPADALMWELDAASPGENGFVRVSYGGNYGYVLEEYVRGTSSFPDMDLVAMYVTNCEEYITLRASANADAAEKARIPLGGEVQVKSALDGEFSYVWYQGMDGYVRSEYLGFLPPQGDIIRGAGIHVPGSGGEGFVQIVNGAEAQPLNALLRSARPGEVGQCPNGAQLRLVLEDGTPDGRVLKLMMPLDGCMTLIAENEAVYQLPEECSEQFWAIFQEAGNYRL